jgi:hypothetical protein
VIKYSIPRFNGEDSREWWIIYQIIVKKEKYTLSIFL